MTLWSVAGCRLFINVSSQWHWAPVRLSVAFGPRWPITNSELFIEMEVVRTEAAEGGSPGAAFDVASAVKGMLVDSGSATIEGKTCEMEGMRWRPDRQVAIFGERLNE